MAAATTTDRAEGLVGLEEAARRAGLHYMTVYRHVRTGRLPAVQRDGRWWVDPTDLTQLAVRGYPGRGAGPARWTDARRRLVDRMLAADHGGTWAVVEQALTRGASPADIYLRLLGPGLAEVGRRWADGVTTVQGEHRATAVAVRVVGRLAPRFVGSGTPGGGTVLLGGAPGDPHLLPVVMAADLLRSRHVRVLDLGADVPEESYLEAAATVPGVRAVGVSLSDSGRARAAAGVLRSLRRAHPGVLLLAGGPAVTDRNAALELGADGWAPDGLAAADLLQP
ncbi:MAG TPA: cobalamin-dependent protein [Candidatus Dormibacteraeota bacterium]|nr:cobalamin-dependent protein [Candidatus Dormibacteraeota bacterium]